MNRRELLAWLGIAVAVCLVPLVGSVAPVSALATTTTALYDMNEAAGNAVLVDSSGNGVNGASGPNVSKGVLIDGATVHSYSRFTGDGVTPRSPTMLPVEPERLDTVPHSTLHNPDTQDFAVTVRYRTDKSFGNLVQKGQNGTAGGYFKVELPGGRPTCLFKGVGMQGAVKPPAATPGLPDPYDLSDNLFHTVKCERLQNRVALWIDGVEVNRKVGPTGNIANTKNLSIAGKSVCDQVLTTCDYFVGDIDWVRIEKGSTVVTNPPPVASFTNTCTFLSCAFDASASSDPNGTIASYAWNFGDNISATGASPTRNHTYATSGTKTVTLTVTDNGGTATSTTRTFTVSANTPPTAAFTSTCADFGCTFDASGSTDANGPIATYSWTFGDGATGTGVSPAHSYAGPGDYNVALTVTDGTNLSGNTSKTVTIVANQPPAAAFVTNCNGLTCSFDGSTSTDPNGPIASYAWDFGDLTTGSGVTTPHTFGAPGTYAVALTVSDSFGVSNTATATVTVTVVVQPNIAFVDQTSVSAQLATHVASVPATVQPGDALLLFFSSGTAATVGQPTGVTGWTQVDSIGGGAITGSTTVWRKVAVAGDAGAQVSIAVSALSKGNIIIAAYRGTSATNPVASFSRQLITSSSATRTTPMATLGVTTWALSYWMHRDGTTTALTPPAGVASRSNGTQTGGGRVTTLLADSGASVNPGPYGGLTATAAAASSVATTWTIVLAPA